MFINDSLIQSYNSNDVFTHVWNTTGITKGKHEIILQVTDDAGNLCTDKVQVTFGLLDGPEVFTDEIISIKPYYAECVYTIAPNQTIYGSGICWSTHENPTINDFKNDYNIDIKYLNDLTPNTTYYVRAFARNSNGYGYGNQLQFTTPSPHFAQGTAVVDVDNNTYATVEIGTQTWMAENLKTKHYADGTSIHEGVDLQSYESMSTPKFYFYPNQNSSNVDEYGLLYTWYTIADNTICPSGYRIPTYDEWTELLKYLGWVQAGGKVKEAGYDHWDSENVNEGQIATNESNFSARAAGLHHPNGWAYDFLGNAFFWSITEQNSTNGYGYFFNSTHLGVIPKYDDKKKAFSVRCIKN